MKNALISFVALLFILNTPSALAMSKLECRGTPHTTHVISTNQDATCVLSKLYEPAHFCLTDAKGKNISGIPFTVTSAQGGNFGMIFDANTDFNMEYALTCVANDNGYQKSPKVIFTIGADGPADPNISVINLYGAEGTWTATGVGENYSLTF